jgi:hypothetical protein
VQPKNLGNPAAVACNGGDALWQCGNALMWKQHNRGNAAAVVTTRWQRCSCCGKNTAEVAMWLLWRQRGCCGDNAMAVLLLWQRPTRLLWWQPTARVMMPRHFPVPR